MQRNGVTLPEPFAAALAEARARDVVDDPAPTPAARFARALARLAVGRDDDARRDLTEAATNLGDACRVEIAFLDIRQRSALVPALAAARKIAERPDVTAPVRGRALHVVGLAEGKLRRTARALEALLDARSVYAALEDRTGASHVHDTLGMLHAARGALDQAVYFYALSLVDKALLGDRHGMAITLGNVGRLHLRAGRFEDALDCFRRDLALSTSLGDVRGQARMKQDIGRAHLGRGDADLARASFAEALDLADTHGFRDLAFFTYRDQCVLGVQTGDLAGAAEALARAEVTQPRGGERYFEWIVATARGALLRAQADTRATDVLGEAVKRLTEADLPDLEIPARLELAAALVDAGRELEAERCLMQGLHRARIRGYARYLPALNEALTSLGLVEGALEEEQRPMAATTETEPGAYILRECVGAGGFGEVHRAYDPERGREVALKRIRLGRLYDEARRRALLDSARVELEAASRVRHPGVVRVHALGTLEEGDIYVTQDFVAGASLREVMDAEPRPRIGRVMALLCEIAHALAALHEASVVHRDLKPDNVIVHPDGTPVLVDFGIAHLAKDGGAGPDWIAGTIAYMAPEQMQGRRVDGRADLYALGVIGFEWLAGLLPVEPRGLPFDDEVRHMTTAPMPRVSEFRPDVPREAEALIAALLERKPRKRATSAADVAGALEELSRARG